jgi:lincosamide nucleotidyltransferase A/C/D/E
VLIQPAPRNSGHETPGAYFNGTIFGVTEFRSSGMTLLEVFAVLDALQQAGCRYWLEGGWGIDALIGRQTRAHRDIDVDIDAQREAAALSALEVLGYVIETDWRPNRVELVAPRRGWVDVHRLLINSDGSAHQPALGGGYHHFPKSYFVTGSLEGAPVPCVSVAAQRRFHSGYELSEADLHDLEQLAGPD